MPGWNGSEALLQEPLDAPGPRRRWRADADGREALAIEAQMASPREAAAVGERLRRLHARPDRNLREILGWAVEGAAAWVLTEPDDGRSLATLLRQGPLTPAEGAAVAWSVLSALEAVHQAGVAHGSVSPENVMVDESGRVRLGGGWFLPSARAASGELEADVEAAGAVGLAALGLAPTAGGPASRAELAAPALSRTLRAIASGASGSNVAGARLALGATAGPLVEPEGLAGARELLLRRVVPHAPGVPLPIPSGRTAAALPVPAAAPPVRRVAELEAGAAPASEATVRPAPAVPARHYVATAADFESVREGADWRARLVGFDISRLAVPLVGIGAVLVFAALAWVGIAAVTRAASAPPATARPPAAAQTATPRATARASAAPTPKPSAGPNFGPTSAPPITSVSIQLSGCSPGSSCGSDIVVHTSAAGAPTDIAWTVRAYDPCTGATTDIGSGHFTEQAGWNTIDVSQSLGLPAARGQLLVAAVVTSPATAASAPATVGQGSC